ncbi:hypothetical protein ITJ86_03935 [Winogradskyella sp. F6397]|uniref:Uncharacterized protein n=1 Tax=Winogradskyella marina TaxID=2785530 RepID=A0ABS0EEZ5_9FLAO|nr:MULTISPECIES: hypothetical protein [Winogradskyella]MBF8149032.1 hypothetical protein [Winogradskyella marina]
MKNTDILAEISSVTRDIEDNYPELQKYLSETRSTLPNGSNNEASLDKNDLEKYLNELKEIRDKYKEKH